MMALAVVSRLAVALAVQSSAAPADALPSSGNPAPTIGSGGGGAGRPEGSNPFGIGAYFPPGAGQLPVAAELVGRVGWVLILVPCGNVTDETPLPVKWETFDAAALVESAYALDLNVVVQSPPPTRYARIFYCSLSWGEWGSVCGGEGARGVSVVCVWGGILRAS